MKYQNCKIYKEEGIRLTLAIAFIATYVSLIFGLLYFFKTETPFTKILNNIFIVYNSIIALLFFFFIVFTGLIYNYQKEKKIILIIINDVSLTYFRGHAIRKWLVISVLFFVLVVALILVVKYQLIANESFVGAIINFIKNQ